ncbi:hypothetical protein ES708_22946 [subsurface metagenome]
MEEYTKESRSELLNNIEKCLKEKSASLNKG